jgi:hypothetical protein
MKNKLPQIGDSAPLYIEGSRFEYVILEVQSAKRVVVQQGYTVSTACGPKEVVTLRKSGMWVPQGGSEDGRSSGYHSVWCR